MSLNRHRSGRQATSRTAALGPRWIPRFGARETGESTLDHIVSEEPQPPGSGPLRGSNPRCRFCGTRLVHTFVDLGMSPLCENILTTDQLEWMEPFYPLHVRICHSCLLVQLPEYVPPEQIFTEYAYFSSYSDTWIEHARSYAETMIAREKLGPSHLVVELASNDGYLLQHFARQGIPVLGIEPAQNVAAVALERDIPTVTEFFTAESRPRLPRGGPARRPLGRQ